MPKKTKTKPINSKAKGSTWERSVAKLLTEWTGFDFHRVPASGGLRWGKDNRVAGDLIAQQGKYWPFTVECKFHKIVSFNELLTDTKSKIMEFWKQALSDAKRVDDTLEPFVAFRYNGLTKGFFFVMVRRRVFRKMIEAGFSPRADYLIHRNKYVILRSDDLMTMEWQAFERELKK